MEASAAAPPEEMRLSYEDFAKLARTFGETETRGPSLRAEFDGLLRSSGRAAAGEKLLTFEDFYSWWLARQSAAGGTGKLLERASAKLAAIAAGGPLQRAPPAGEAARAEEPKRPPQPPQVAARKGPTPRRARPAKPARPATAPLSVGAPRERRPGWKATGIAPRTSSPRAVSAVRERPHGATPATPNPQASRVSPAEWERPWRDAPCRVRRPSSEAAAPPTPVRAAAKAARAVASAHRSSQAVPEAVVSRRVARRGGSPRRSAPAWRSSRSPDPRPMSPEREAAALPRRIHEDDTARSRPPKEHLRQSAAAVDEFRGFLEHTDALAYESALGRLGVHSFESLAGLSTMQLIDAGIGLSLRNRLRRGLATRGIVPSSDDRYADLPGDASSEDTADGIEALPSRGRMRVMHRSPSLATQHVPDASVGKAAGAGYHQGGTMQSPPTSEFAPPPPGATTPQHDELNDQRSVAQALVHVDADSSARGSSHGHVLPDPLSQAGWEPHTSTRTGKTYYFNPATGDSTYSMPSTPDGAASIMVSAAQPANTQGPRAIFASPRSTLSSEASRPDGPEGHESTVAELEEQAIDLRKALAEIASLVAEHPENVELRGMMVDTTAALTVLDERLARMPLLPELPEPGPKQDRELAGGTEQGTVHLEKHVVVHDDTPAAEDAAQSLAALASLLEEKQAALTALLRECGGMEGAVAAKQCQLEDLLNQVEALDALLGPVG